MTAAGAARATAPKIAAETAKAMTRTSKTKARASARKPPSRRPEGGKEVRFTHPDRVYWADAGVTKQDLADYYRSVWDWMAPRLVSRALALLRCPDGTSGQCFFQKHASAGLSEKSLRTVIDRKGRQINAGEDPAGLLSPGHV